LGLGTERCPRAGGGGGGAGWPAERVAAAGGGGGAERVGRGAEAVQALVVAAGTERSRAERSAVVGPGARRSAAVAAGERAGVEGGAVIGGAVVGAGPGRSVVERGRGRRCRLEPGARGHGRPTAGA